MRADLLHVVTAIQNPIRWQSRERLFREFEQHMLASGAQLTVIECQYGERPFVLAGTPGVNHIGVRAKTMLWEKERLINIAISRLPSDWQYVAWIDADVMFRRPAWASETVHALQLYQFVQPWSDCYDLGPNDEHLALHRSFCRIHHDGKPIMQGPNAGHSAYTFAHPGYAWAATRSALEISG
jgi:hypothetical protein